MRSHPRGAGEAAQVVRRFATDLRSRRVFLLSCSCSTAARPQCRSLARQGCLQAKSWAQALVTVAPFGDVCVGWVGGWGRAGNRVWLVETKKGTDDTVIKL